MRTSARERSWKASVSTSCSSRGFGLPVCAFLLYEEARLKRLPAWLGYAGAAFLALTFFYDDDFAVPASILFSLGVGYLIATFVSWRLSANMGGGDVFHPNQTTNP